MNFFDKLKKKFFNSSDEKTIKMSEILDLFSGSRNSVEHGQDLSEVTYYTCLKVLSESIGKIPIYLLDSKKRRVTDHEAMKILRISTNAYMTPSQFFSTMEFNRNHRGNAYSYIKRRSNGDIESLIPLNSLSVQVWLNDTDSFTDITYFYFYSDTRTGKSYYLNPEDVLHFRSWICEDNGIVGRSVREILARTLSGSKASSKFLNDLYERGLLANIAVKYLGDLNKENQEKILTEIEEQSRKKSRRMITIPMGFDIQPLDLKLTDSQFFELKQYQSLQVAAAFGIQPNFLNDYSKSSYANSSMQNLSFYMNTLLFIVTLYEQEMNRKLLTEQERKQGLSFKFNVPVLLRGDPTQQADVIQKMVQTGIYSPNDALSLLDRPPCENGDVHMVNGSYVKLEDIGKAYENRR